jgi:hypothetical protein
MSIKKELLNELTEKQLIDFAKAKGIEFSISQVREKYYENWDEKGKMVDLLSDHKSISISEIEKFILDSK